jgi:hypothetical protein
MMQIVSAENDRIKKGYYFKYPKRWGAILEIEMKPQKS